MVFLEKNILDIENGIICQSVNCQKVQGSGLAKQIRDKWPDVYSGYIEYSNRFRMDFERLGEYHIVQVGKKLAVLSIFGQLFYGNDGKRYSDYSAINSALKSIARDRYYMKETYYFPYKIFSDRGGADWSIVSKMIEYYFPNAIICKLPEKQFS